MSSPTSKIAPVKKRIIQNASVQAALPAALAAQAEWQKYESTIAHLLDPNSYRKAHEVAISKAGDAAEVEHHARRLGQLDADSCRAAAGRVRTLAMVELEKFRNSVAPLVDAAEAALTELQGEAKQAEGVLFAEFALPVERTGVSRRLDAIGEEVKHLRSSLSPQVNVGHQPVLKNAFGHVLDWFKG